MLQCFISHCSDDLESIVNQLDSILSKHFSKNKYSFFCSSTSSNPLLPGTDVGGELKKKLKESKCMIAIVTDNYLRSPISLTELSAKWFSGDNSSIIPLVFSSEGENYFKQKFISNLVYLNTMDTKRSRINAELMLKCLKENNFIPKNDSNFLDELTYFFETCKQNASKRAFIGSGDVYQNINSFCEDKGIKQLGKGVLSPDIVRKRLARRKEIFIVMTTGSSFIDTYSKDFLQNEIANGTSVYMILPNKHSDFCKDVAFVESPENNIENYERISREFDSAVSKLKFVLNEAKTLASNKNNIGHVFICAAYNLLRQTICIGRSENDECWGWLNTTMPPARTAGNTPTIVFEGNASDKDSFCHVVYQHVQQLIYVARQRNGLIDLVNEPHFSSFENDEIKDVSEKQEIIKKWKVKFETACKYMEKRQAVVDRVLIEIAAQHPLKGELPGEEFKARLDYGYQLYQKLRKSGKNVYIYVPGSKHMFNGNIDLLTLSEAGCRYLLSLGIEKDKLFGDNENMEYMGENGVYNSCDECFVSSSIFNDYSFGQLHCVCSPNQVTRKQLFYLNYKIVPFIHTVSEENMFHNFTDELFNSVPTVLYKYPDWSIPECPIFEKSRLERMPGYRKG
ncbi:MAG: TIR domain-containing protein [Spirochaetaceae bacterium]|nr:TIR domain-containing protein [Spirochaetaceae bacterium]